MYKVSVSEKEARGIGESRWWVAKNKWRYYLAIFLPLGAIFLLIWLSSPNMFNLSDWVSMPFAVVLVGLSTYFLWRGSKLCTKAGKEFVQSLRKEE